MEESVKVKKPRQKRSPNKNKRISSVIPQEVLKLATEYEMAVLIPVIAQFKILRDILSSETPLLLVQEMYDRTRKDLEDLSGPLFARHNLSK